jgi:predicted PurR-regulated permease PerM
MRAYGIIMVVTFIELSIGLSFLRISGAIRIAAITAVLDILPLLGSGSVLIPWSVYHLIAGSPATGVGLLLLYAAITVIRNIIEPRIVGDQLGLHPVVTLCAMFIGMRLIGVLGIFLMPIAALLIRYLTTVEGLPLYKA